MVSDGPDDIGTSGLRRHAGIRKLAEVGRQLCEEGARRGSVGAGGFVMGVGSHHRRHALTRHPREESDLLGWAAGGIATAMVPPPITIRDTEGSAKGPATGEWDDEATE